MRRAHRGPSRRRRYALAVPARRRGRGHPVSDPGRARRRQRARGRSLLLGHARRACLGALDGPEHGDGSGGGNRRRHGPPGWRRHRARGPRRLRAAPRRDGAVLDVATGASSVGAGTRREDWWLGFDIGGTRTKLGVVAPDGTVSRPHMAETDRAPFATVWQRCSTTPRSARRTPARVCAAWASRRRASSTRSLASATCLARSRHRGFPAARSPGSCLGVPVRCVNDGAAATLAEWRFGAARGQTTSSA